MNPSHTGAARYGASGVPRRRIGTASMSPPAAMQIHPAGRSGWGSGSSARLAGARRSRRLEIRSPVSNIAGQIVANDQAYPK